MRIKRRHIPTISKDLESLPKIIQRVYAARGVETLAEVATSLSELLPFHRLKNIEAAAACLWDAMVHEKRILVIGDFDADGATSTALAVSALRAMGHAKVDFLVPNRFEFGYGLSEAIVRQAALQSPDLLMTVDNGITNLEGVALARSLGMTVVITDHHLAGPILPDATVIVNPNQPDDHFESKSLAGVGVIFYVMLALRAKLREEHWFTKHDRSEPNMAQYLDLVALGTVADVVPLDRNNRILIAQGLSRMREGHVRPGIRALIEISNRTLADLREVDLGFSVAPRLNAAGRLDDMSIGILCLLTTSDEEARRHAEILDEFNRTRRHIESKMKEEALSLLSHAAPVSHDVALKKGLCLMHASWHQGVIGILAGRLKEQYHCPVIVFAHVSEHELKGSARSISALNMRDVLAEIDRMHPHLLLKFGGHAMAAGLSIRPADFEAFRHVFLEVLEKSLHPDDCEAVLWSDGALLQEDLTLTSAEMLASSGPWGAQFPAPMFDGCFELLDQRLLAGAHLKLTVRHEAGGEPLDAIFFHCDVSIWPNYRARWVHLAYQLDVNQYQHRKKLQLYVRSLDVTSSDKVR